MLPNGWLYATYCLVAELGASLDFKQFQKQRKMKETSETTAASLPFANLVTTTSTRPWLPDWHSLSRLGSTGAVFGGHVWQAGLAATVSHREMLVVGLRSAGQTSQENDRQIEPSCAHNGTHRYDMMWYGILWIIIFMSKDCPTCSWPTSTQVDQVSVGQLYSTFRCGQTAAQLRGHDKDYTERLAHLKARLFEQSRLSWGA